MSRKANVTTKRKKSEALLEFKNNFSDSLPTGRISGEKLLEGETLNRSLRAPSKKANQPPPQNDIDWWARRKNSTDGRKNGDARFETPVKTSQSEAECRIDQNQPKYLFQDELELLKNETPVLNTRKNSAVIVKRDTAPIRPQGHSMKSLAVDVLFCEQCAAFKRLSGTAESSSQPHQHQTNLLPSPKVQAVQSVWKQRSSSEDSDTDVLTKSTSIPWTYERRFESDSDCD